MHNRNTIIHMLERSEEPRLADVFDEVPMDVQHAISAMVQTMYDKQVNYWDIVANVVADVAASLEGKQQSGLKCFGYIYKNNQTIGSI